MAVSPGGTRSAADVARAAYDERVTDIKPPRLYGSERETLLALLQFQRESLIRKITGVKVLQQTNTGVLSQQIDSNSIPQLTKETLTVQSARIDSVSGATATSTGYINSLQSALDKL